MPQVQVIQPIQQQPKRLRVAAYARVSSDSTDQLNSLSVQVDYYTHLIQENPNWDFAGIYADEGITGTSTKHREQFNRLLDDCRAGLIDRVLVKSASRFARNTADALASVREMKSLGVTVVFEKEGFDTETANGEMILSMICATAQEESLSISQNTKWGIRKKMHDGTYITSLTPFGYKKINRQLFPDEKEAATVKEIFNLFLNGFSTAEIANHLNTNHPKPDVIWRSASVRFILRNEKYIGDSLFQKNYTPDTLPLKSCCNTGQLPKYYSNGDSLQQIATHMSSCGPPYRSSDNRWNKNIIARLLSCDIYCGTATYPAIITKELYFQVQQLRNEKSVSYSSVLQSFRDDMQCCCGERLYWYPKTHQWYCRHCGMWSNRIRPEELSQQLREKLFWICRHNERICSPQGASNIHSIESSRLSHEINTLLASPEPDAESIVRKILHRAELQFTCCSAGDADPATLQIKRACNELEPTDTFPLKLYAEIVSNVILYRDTHIEIKLRNGQIL